MFDIKEFLRNGNFGPIELGIELEKAKELLPTPDYEAEFDTTIFLFYGDIELSFPVFKDDLKRKLFYVQVKFMQRDGTCKQSKSYPVRNEILKAGISKKALKHFCFKNGISVRRGNSLDPDYENLILGRNATCIFVKDKVRDLGYKGLVKVIAS